jgi:hypothetical protein
MKKSTLILQEFFLLTKPHNEKYRSKKALDAFMLNKISDKFFRFGNLLAFSIQNFFDEFISFKIA